ncbi:MAG: lysostaphin resistance A-like protein [Candidatus Acidiferrales bacterium]
MSSTEPNTPLPPQWPTPAGETPAPAEVRADLRVCWNWRDVFGFILFAFISSVVVSMLAGFAAGKLLHLPPSAIPEGSTVKSIVVVVGQAIWSVIAIVYLYTAVAIRTPDSFWRSIGWRRLAEGTSPLRFLSGGALLAIGVQVAGQFVSRNVELPIEKMFENRISVLLLMALGVLVAPLVEETIFRGFLYPVIARQFGVPAGILVTGVLFGSLHAAQLWGGWGQIGLLICVGIVLTWVRARTGTVVASYLVHLGYNGMLFLGLALATGGLRHLPPHA